MPTAHELPDPAAFSQRLNACLERFGYSERGGGKRLADEFGVKPPVVSDWRRGRFLPSAAKVRAMAKQWRVPYDWLYWGEGRSPFTGVGEARTAYAPKTSGQDSAIDELRIVVSALIAVLAAKRPAEAAALSAALKRTVSPEKLREGLMVELLSVLDG